MNGGGERLNLRDFSKVGAGRVLVNGRGHEGEESGTGLGFAAWVGELMVIPLMENLTAEGTDGLWGLGIMSPS